MAKKEPPKPEHVKQTDFPQYTLQDAMKIAQGLWDNYAGRSAAPHDIALAIDVSPTSSDWRVITGSSVAYGLTEGGYNANQITLTDLGRRLVAPLVEGDDLYARIDAILRPRIMREFYERYDKAKFPKDTIGQNVLAAMGLPRDRAARAFQVLEANGAFAGVIRPTKNGPFLALTSSPPVNSSQECAVDIDAGENSRNTEHEGIEVVASESLRTNVAVPVESKRQLFVAHGKNHKPLEELKKILNEFKIPYKVAIDEPNKGRPISNKVATLMNECSAGIFIFTKDEKFLREVKGGEFEEVWRPSENVVYELGAASINWEQKIIIMREEGVNFPSDFSDLGYIKFGEGGLSSKALEIVKELIALQLVRVSAA